MELQTLTFVQDIVMFAEIVRLRDLVFVIEQEELLKSVWSGERAGRGKVKT